MGRLQGRNRQLVKSANERCPLLGPIMHGAAAGIGDDLADRPNASKLLKNLVSRAGLEPATT
jgi:hypothetical protein